MNGEKPGLSFQNRMKRRLTLPRERAFTTVFQMSGLRVIRPSDLIQSVPNFVALFLLQLASQRAGNNSNRILL